MKKQNKKRYTSAIRESQLNILSAAIKETPTAEKLKSNLSQNFAKEFVKNQCQKKLIRIEDEDNITDEILKIIKKNNLTFENFEEVIPKIELFFKNNATI